MFTCSFPSELGVGEDVGAGVRDWEAGTDFYDCARGIYVTRGRDMYLNFKPSERNEAAKTSTTLNQKKTAFKWQVT